MSLPPIEEGIYRQLEKDIMSWLYRNPKKHDEGGSDLAWHDTRHEFIKFLVYKGYSIVE